MSTGNEPATAEFEIKAQTKEEPDYFMYFSLFLLAFWPVALILGVADYFFFPDRDLRLLDLLMGGIAGGSAVSFYRSKERKRLDS